MFKQYVRIWLYFIYDVIIIDIGTYLNVYDNEDYHIAL